MTNSVPDRWLDYKAFGGIIKDTKILAFKVPLKDAIVRNLKPEQRFTTTILRQAFPHLKCIVDLTNTYRYYDKQEFTNAGIKYEKIAIPGRKIPSIDIIEKFFKVMDDFTSTCGEGDLIGVHCTHGVNRTGYLICRYLIQQKGWETQDSLKAFGEARGYPVERDIYLNALKEVQRGEKIDTSKIMPTNPTDVALPARKTSLKARSSYKNSASRSNPFPIIGPFAMRRGFANGAGPFSPQRFNFAGPPPAFGPMPPPPGRPPIPLMGPPPPYGARPFRYGAPPMRPAMPPTPPGFPRLGSFPSSRIPPPGPPRMKGPPRLPPTGPITHGLPSAKMPPPLLPPPLSLPPSRPSSRTPAANRQPKKKQQHIRNGIVERTASIRSRRNGSNNNVVMPKVHKEQDFTVDTFEENLASSSSHSRRIRRRFSRTK